MLKGWKKTQMIRCKNRRHKTKSPKKKGWNLLDLCLEKAFMQRVKNHSKTVIGMHFKDESFPLTFSLCSLFAQADISRKRAFRAKCSRQCSKYLAMHRKRRSKNSGSEKKHRHIRKKKQMKKKKSQPISTELKQNGIRFSSDTKMKYNIIIV